SVAAGKPQVPYCSVGAPALVADVDPAFLRRFVVFPGRDGKSECVFDFELELSELPVRLLRAQLERWCCRGIPRRDREARLTFGRHVRGDEEREVADGIVTRTTACSFPYLGRLSRLAGGLKADNQVFEAEHRNGRFSLLRLF